MASDAWYKMNPGAAGAPPQQQPNPGQFDNNPYQNPQMGQYGGQPPGWVNPNSPMQQWGNSFMPPEAMWQGPAPGHQGQDYSYKPVTGQGGWENSYGGLQIGGSNPYGSGAVSWMDPNTGLRAIDPQGLMSAFGMDWGLGRSD